MRSDSFLTPADLAALALFIGVWVFHTYATAGKFWKRASLTTAMNRQRDSWMKTMARRDLRMIDTSIMTGLQQGTAFFASASLIAIGGCFALLGRTEQALDVLTDLPFVAAPARGMIEFKLLGLIVLLAYSFFKFGWAYRLFNYCSILIGAVPMMHEGEADMDEAVQRAARMNILAGAHFNAGLRGIFFSIGYLGWFVGPLFLVASTLFVLAVLIRRQFFSRAREAVL